MQRPLTAQIQLQLLSGESDISGATIRSAIHDCRKLRQPHKTEHSLFVQGDRSAVVAKPSFDSTSQFHRCKLKSIVVSGIFSILHNSYSTRERERDGAISMEDSSLLQNLTLIPSEAAFSFPQHRRRPIRSRTYLALIGILSHCHTNSSQLQIEDDGGDFQLRPVSEENGSIHSNGVNSKAVLVSLPNSNQSKETPVKESSNSESMENNGVFDSNQATTPKLDHINSVTDGDPEVAPENSISNGELLVVENKKGDCATQVANEQDDANIVLDNQMDELGILEELVVDEEFSIDEYSAVLDSCFGMDMVIEPSTRVEGSKDTILEENISKEAEYELQLKEMELEKLMFSSGAVNSLSCQIADEEIEEGEISGEVGIADAPYDALNEEATSLGESAGMVHASEDSYNKGEFLCNDDEDRGYRQHQMSETLLKNVVNSDCNSMNVGSRTTGGEMQDCHSQNVFHDSHMEIQRSGPIAPFSEKQSLPDRDFQENAAKCQKAAIEKDGDAKEKKRKKGPLTQERRAKKKKKDRLKRAEKNRQLGVKRLKLQPVLKPKTVSYCRHFMHGRCHEGEKCKFSHDTVPLTKSKPCGHFARHSCMKGDDCPFDHQLSKYPCKNFTENGFCSRGSDCLFSHEIVSMTPTASKPELTPAQHTEPDKGGSSSKVSRPVLNFSSPLHKSNPRPNKQTDSLGIYHQKVDAKSAELAAKTVPRTVGRAPKGISFLSNVNTVCKTSVNKLNEKPEEIVIPRKPRGINFLSFTRPTSEESSSQVFSKLLSNSNNETRKTIMDDTSGGIPTCSLPASCGILKVNTQMNQIASNLVRDLSEKVNGNLGTIFQQRNFSSFDKTRLEVPKGGSDLPSVHERQSTPMTSFKSSFLSNAPSSVQKAAQSTLAFAANYEPDIKVRSFLQQQEARISQEGSVMP